MSVELEPSELGFKRPFTQEVSQVLRLRNPTSGQVAFKVKTTAPKQYCVRPNSGRIDANGFVEVQVLLQAMKEDPPPDARCRDKFLVQSVAVPPTLDPNSNITQIWQSVESTSKGSIQERKIRVTFLPAEGQASGLQQQHHDEDDHAPMYSSPSPAAVTPQRPVRTTDGPMGAAIGSSSTFEDRPEGAKNLGEARESAHNPAMNNGTYRDYASTMGNAASAVTSSIPTSQDDVRRQLDDAKATISRLQEQASEGLRQRKVPGTSGATDEKSSLSQSMKNAPPGGVSVPIVAALCLICFLIAYLFF